jgi:hypothetical protein
LGGIPRVARSSQPWALGLNLFEGAGTAKSHSAKARGNGQRREAVKTAAGFLVHSGHRAEAAVLMEKGGASEKETC